MNHVQLAENMWVSVLWSWLKLMWLQWGVDKLCGTAACWFCCLFLCISMVMDWVRMLHSDWSIDLLNRALQPCEDVLLSVSLTHVKSAPVSSFLTMSLYISCFFPPRHPSCSSYPSSNELFMLKGIIFKLLFTFMPCAFMWSFVLCFSINCVKWPPWINTTAGCVYPRYNALCLNVSHIMNVCLCVLCKGVYQYLCV